MKKIDPDPNNFIIDYLVSIGLDIKTGLQILIGFCMGMISNNTKQDFANKLYKKLLKGSKDSGFKKSLEDIIILVDNMYLIFSNKKKVDPNLTGHELLINEIEHSVSVFEFMFTDDFNPLTKLFFLLETQIDLYTPFYIDPMAGGSELFSEYNYNCTTEENSSSDDQIYVNHSNKNSKKIRNQNKMIIKSNLDHFMNNGIFIHESNLNEEFSRFNYINRGRIGIENFASKKSDQDSSYLSNSIYSYTEEMVEEKMEVEVNDLLNNFKKINFEESDIFELTRV